MKAAVIAAALAGLALAAGLIVYFGADAVLAALASAGWQGLVLITLAHFASVFLCSLGWNAVLAAPLATPVRVVLWARYVRDSLGNLIGLIPATGEIAAARELTFHGVRPVAAAASTIVDMTAELISQVIFTIAGVGVLLARGADREVMLALLAALALAALAILGFFIAQRRGLLRLLETLSEKLGFAAQWASFADEHSLHDAVAAIYAQRWRMPASVALHVAAWAVAAFETWLALYVMAQPVSFADALALESVVFAARTAAFFLPWAAGVQEGGYVIVGGLLGVPPETALALSVLKRARELIAGAPGMIAWQFVEGRRLARTPAKKKRAAP